MTPPKERFTTTTVKYNRKEYEALLIPEKAMREEVVCADAFDHDEYEPYSIEALVGDTADDIYFSMFSIAAYSYSAPCIGENGGAYFLAYKDAVEMLKGDIRLWTGRLRDMEKDGSKYNKKGELSRAYVSAEDEWMKADLNLQKLVAFRAGLALGLQRAQEQG